MRGRNGRYARHVCDGCPQLCEGLSGREGAEYPIPCEGWRGTSSSRFRFILFTEKNNRRLASSRKFFSSREKEIRFTRKENYVISRCVLIVRFGVIVGDFVHRAIVQGHMSKLRGKVLG